jgi:hypothetical protein
VRTHATNRVGKTSLKNCQILENLLKISRFPSPISRFPSPISRFPSPKIRFSSHEIQFSPIGFLLSSTAFRFLQRLSAFFNNFLIFFNGFPLSSMAFRFSSMAFCFPRNPRKSIYGGKYTKDHYLSFVFPPLHSLPKLRNSRYIVYISPTVTRQISPVFNISSCLGTPFFRNLLWTALVSIFFKWPFGLSTSSKLSLDITLYSVPVFIL